MAGGASQDDDGIISGINVTPFVDVALVLLIIFMVTAKYIVTPQAIPVDLPHTSTATGVVTAVSVSIDAAGAVYLDAHPVDEAQLGGVMAQRHRENPDVRAIIAADQRVTHGRVIHVIDLIRRAGVTRFAIQTQNDSAPGPTAPGAPGVPGGAAP